MTETVKYWRTTFGTHRHVSEYCANARRAIGSGYPTVIPTAEVSSWAACEHCCSESEVHESVAAVQAKQDEMCRNTGVTHPKRLSSKCKDCEKTGKVNRSTGSLRAHKPV
jgi:hypothetical protein